MPLIYCPECAKQISSLHHSCPNCGQKFRDPPPPEPEVQPAPAAAPKAKSRVPAAVLGWVGALTAIAVMVTIVVWLGAGRLALAGGSSGQKSDTVEETENFIAKYGVPDRDDSNQYQSPRPLMITRVLTYEEENIRVVCIPRAEKGAAPPYKAWKLMMFQDTRDNAVLTSSLVAERLSKRMPRP